MKAPLPPREVSIPQPIFTGTDLVAFKAPTHIRGRDGLAEALLEHYPPEPRDNDEPQQRA